MILYRYNPILHRLALLTACATFPLIFLGGLVTSHGAGMSVPDWPTSFGYNMYLLPLSQWWHQGGIFYEHSHRLVASGVGFSAIILAVAAWWMERRVWVRRLAYLTLGFVIFQGILGGLRVMFVNLDLAIVHGITAQVFFCVAALVAITTSRWWNLAPNLAWSEDYPAGQKLIRLAWITVGCVFLQLIVGAIMRHEQAGLAIIDLPLAYGRIIPPISADAVEQANNERTAQLLREQDIMAKAGNPRSYELSLDRVTAGQIWLHFAHRLGAILVSTVTIWLSVKVFQKHRNQSGLFIPAVCLCILLLTQVTLGVATVYYRKPADVASAHVATGALLLLTCFTIAVRSMRLYSRRYRMQAESVRVEVRSIGSREFLAT